MLARRCFLERKHSQTFAYPPFVNACFLTPFFAALPCGIVILDGSVLGGGVLGLVFWVLLLWCFNSGEKVIMYDTVPIESHKSVAPR